MPKHLLSCELIIQTALTECATVGLEQLSLKQLAQTLHVSPPALFKHIDGLDSLRAAVLEKIVEILRQELITAGENFEGVELLKEIAFAFVAFAKAHPKWYQAVQWEKLAAEQESHADFQQVVQKIYAICQKLGADELEASHIIRTVRALAQGFADLDSHQSFSHPSKVEDSLIYAYDTFFLGIDARFLK